MTANAEKQGEVFDVSRDELPLSCPRPGDEVWNMHPRVYLPIEKTGQATCPYCGAHFRLKERSE